MKTLRLYANGNFYKKYTQFDYSLLLDEIHIENLHKIEICYKIQMRWQFQKTFGGL